MRKKVLSVLLVFALLFGLMGCQQKPVETQPPTTETTAPPETTVPAPTAPDGSETYAEAKALLEGAADVTLEVVIERKTAVKEQDFFTETIQQLSWQDLDSETPMVSVSEKIAFMEPGTAFEENYLTYEELWAEGILYTSLEDGFFFSSELEQDAMAARYLPVILLDESLYGSISSELQGSDVLVTFTEPSAAEAWALPEGAELTDAEAQAVITAGGELKQMLYSCSYTWGSASCELSVCAEVLEEAQDVTVPENADEYVMLQYPDALKSYINTTGYLYQSSSVQISSIESITSQAAGVVHNQSVAMDYFNFDGDPLTKLETDIYFMDYNTGDEQKLKQEETFIDGVYVVTLDNAVPTTYDDIDAEVIGEYCRDVMLTCSADPSYWTEATVEDLGSVYLVSYTYDESLGASLQNSICTTLWNDAAFLNNLASAYENREITGYLAFEKYTGIPTAAGYYYEGVHTIEGGKYTLSLQADQSITVPAFGAYHEITEEWLPESEPENKATPLFYHVTGENGQELWLLGTIHVGDERTGYLPQEIYDALAASDALALECDTESFDKEAEEDDKLQEQVSSLYYYSNGKTAGDYLDEETYTLAVKHMKASGNYSMNAPYLKLSMWANSIENFLLHTGHLLTSEQGVEERLTKLAREQEKEILEVESNMFQIELLTGWSDDLQILLLEESLDTAPEESWQNLEELYELWCAGDEAALREELSDEVDLSDLTEEEKAEYEACKHLVEEYNKGMSYDRNDGMLEVAIEYLESDRVVFYAVGLAHLLNNVNGLVDTLREAGYTVELVTYN